MSFFPKQNNGLSQKLLIIFFCFFLCSRLGFSAAGSLNKEILPSVSPWGEFGKVNDVIFTEDFLTYYHGEDVAKEIMKTTANVVIISKPASTSVDLSWFPVTQDVLKKRIQVIKHDFSSQWIRDYGPIFAVENSPVQKIIAGDFFFSAKPDLKNEEDFPRFFAEMRSLKQISIPLEIDGGAFMTNGEYCLVAEPKNGSAKDELKFTKIAPEILAKNLGCRKTIIIRNSPHPHLDMWALFLNKKTLMVSELEASALEMVRKRKTASPSEISLALKIKKNLDDQAAQLAKYFSVVRLPLPFPYRNIFRNYTNAILVNGTAIIPSFRKFGWNYGDYPDAEMMSLNEEKTSNLFKKYGFDPKFFAADGLIFNGGGFHCMIIQEPGIR